MRGDTVGETNHLGCSNRQSWELPRSRHRAGAETTQHVFTTAARASQCRASRMLIPGKGVTNQNGHLAR